MIGANVGRWIVGSEYSAWIPLPENFPPAKVEEKLELELVNPYLRPCNPDDGTRTVADAGKNLDTELGEKSVHTGNRVCCDGRCTAFCEDGARDHPEDNDPGEADPGFPPEDI